MCFFFMFYLLDVFYVDVNFSFFSSVFLFHVNLVQLARHFPAHVVVVRGPRKRDGRRLRVARLVPLFDSQF